MNLEENEMLMKKLVVIINGSGGVGKDTLCNFAHECFCTKSVSSIDPVKRVAREAGWNGEKSPKARKFLSGLKKLMIQFNDAPTMYLLEQYRRFIHSDDKILFCHIREPEEIDKFKTKITTPIVTLLIERDTGVEKWGNTADDDVKNYNYDFKFNNNIPLKEVKTQFISLLNSMLAGVNEIETKDFSM